MDLKSLIENINAKANGEFEDIPANSEEFITIRNIINRKMDEWFFTAKWRDYMKLVEVDTVDKDTLSYELPKNTLSNNNITSEIGFYDDTDKKVANAKITTPDDWAMKGGAALLNNQLIFSEIRPEWENATIKMLACVKPKPLVEPTDSVPSLLATWLTVACSADIASTSPVPFIAQNADRFKKEADVIMARMRKINRNQQNGFFVDRSRRGGGAFERGLLNVE